MHKQWLIFAIFLFVLPMEAQSNQAMPPNGSEVAGNLLPPHDYSSLLAQHQGTSPAAGRTLCRWSVAAVLAEGVADAASGWRAEVSNGCSVTD